MNSKEVMKAFLSGKLSKDQTVKILKDNRRFVNLNTE